MTERRSRVSIEYCTACRFTARALWIAQELLDAFEPYVECIELRPSSGGIFAVSIDDEQVFSNKRAGRFPEPRELKELLAPRLGVTLPQRHG
jgi:selenoprotein W-related protein